MSKHITNNTDNTIRVSFEVGGDYVTPTSATYTLTDNSSNVVDNIENIIIPTLSTTVAVFIPASANVSTREYEVRYLDVNFIYNNVPYTQTYHYYIRSPLRLPLDAQDVKMVIGSDVPDDYIDIYHAYDMVSLDLVGVNLTNIVTSGNNLLPALVDAVKYRAAMNCMISAQTTMMQMEQADNSLYRRFENIDFSIMDDKLSKLYSIAIAKLRGEVEGGTPMTYSTLAVGTDPVTGQ